MLVGEAGIGKTRTAEECAAIAREQGSLVWWGACHEGEWAPPYGPFAEAITAYAREADPEQLRQDLGFGIGPIARLVPALHERLSDIPPPAPLQPDEERHRLLDAVCQFATATSLRAPLLLVLDDLHWADAATVAMLRYVARSVAGGRILLLGAYRDLEIVHAHPLADGLAAMHRERHYERLLLPGLETHEVGRLLETLAEHDVPAAMVATISAETSGNPFFIREVLLHLVEERKLVRQDGRWTSDLGIEEMGIPDSVRQVIERRLARLGEPTNRLLTAAAAFSGVFRFDVAAAVAGLDEADGLSAIEEALRARMVRPAQPPDTYEFTHALIRHALYGAHSPSRRMRLHRSIAGAMERVYGEGVGEHAAEVADQYWRSAGLPGAEQGVRHAVAAADQAEASYAWDCVVSSLRMAIAMLPRGDARYPRVLSRLGLALPWALAFDEAVQVASEAGRLLAENEGPDAAADYLGEATAVLGPAGSLAAAMELSRRGIAYIGCRRDLTWLRLASNDVQRREQEETGYAGMPLDTPERRELAEVAASLSPENRRGIVNVFPVLASREQALRQWGTYAIVQTLWAGDFRTALPGWEERAAREESEGRIDTAATWLAYVARCRLALGDLAGAHAAYERGAALNARLPGSGNAACHLSFYGFERCLAVDDGWAEYEAAERILTAQAGAWALVYAAARRASAAVVAARLGHTERAAELLVRLVGPLERAPAWSPHYNGIICGTVTALWLIRRNDYVDVLEHNLRDKVLTPDFRYPMRDGRLSLARLCVLQDRYDEAIRYFDQTRSVLDEQGARPLRAIVDHDHALAYLRRAASGDEARAERLLDAAQGQFVALGMTGWVRSVEELRRRGIAGFPRPVPLAAGAGSDSQPSGVDRPFPPAETDTGKRPAALIRVDAQYPTIAGQEPTCAGNVFRKEGEYWTLVFEGRTARLKDAKGLNYIAHLLRHAGQDCHVGDLMQVVSCTAPQAARAASDRDLSVSRFSDAGPVLDAQAKHAYKHRLADLRDELDEAERFNDPGRTARARNEIEAITDQLAGAIGLGGRDRRPISDAERARLAVTKCIRAALEKMRHVDPVIARHLSAAITTGYFCAYQPTASALTSWLF